MRFLAEEDGVLGAREREGVEGALLCRLLGDSVVSSLAAPRFLGVMLTSFDGAGAETYYFSFLLPRGRWAI